MNVDLSKKILTFPNLNTKLFDISPSLYERASKY